MGGFGTSENDIMNREQYDFMIPERPLEDLLAPEPSMLMAPQASADIGQNSRNMPTCEVTSEAPDELNLEKRYDFSSMRNN